MQEKHTASPFLTVFDLAERWKKPAQWIYSNWKYIGLNPIAIGKQLRFRLEDIVRWELDNELSTDVEMNKSLGRGVRK